MAFQILFLLPFFWSIATASFNSDVYHALTILNELPADLAEPFCQNYDGGYAPTTTLTETWAPVTSTTTAAPTQCGPWLSTVTGTTTITFTTTSTIYTAAMILPSGVFGPDAFPTNKRRTVLTERASWCDGYDVPCRLVQYYPKEIKEACRQYLAGRGAGYQTANVVSVTETITDATATATADGGCL